MHVYTSYKLIEYSHDYDYVKLQKQNKTNIKFSTKKVPNTTAPVVAAAPIGMPRYLMLGGAIVVLSVGIAAMTMSQTSGAPLLSSRSAYNATSTAVAPVVPPQPPQQAVVYSRQPLWLQRPRNA
jgi:hypothetical protein